MHGAAVVVTCFALVTLLLAWSRWLAGRRLAAAGHVAMATAAAAVALLMWSVTAGLESYEPVSRDQPIASLFVERTGPQRFRATLTRLPAGPVQVFELTGDQRAALDHVDGDLAGPEPMQRLLMGEVGSGKTTEAFNGFHLATPPKVLQDD